MLAQKKLWKVINSKCKYYLILRVCSFLAQSSNCVTTKAVTNSNQEKVDIKLSTAACGDNPIKTCSHSCDSDDDEDEIECLQTLTIHDGDSKEVVTNHKTKSAVDLKSSDLVFELDD